MPANKKKEIDTKELDSLSPEEYEKKYVHKVYNQIASHFSVTRYRPWPQVESFLKSLSADSIMIDVGCGNGKNLGISPGTNIGCDICPELLEIAKERGHNVIECDALNLSFDNEIADVVISIAVIHHFVNPERRIKAIQEMLRILKPGGQMLIYVWAKGEENNNDFFVGWSNNKKINQKNVNDTNDEDEEKLNRYYHFFEERELEELCLQAGECMIEKSYFDKENWAVVVRKPQKIIHLFIIKIQTYSTFLISQSWKMWIFLVKCSNFIRRNFFHNFL